MAAKAIVDAEAREVGLQKTKKITRRVVLDGSTPIPVVPLTTVAATKSTSGWASLFCIPHPSKSSLRHSRNFGFKEKEG